jgi:hypothetical protein
MPITRRKRANPPDQPENNHHEAADQTEGAVEQPLQAEPAPASFSAEAAEVSTGQASDSTSTTLEGTEVPETPRANALAPAEPAPTPAPAPHAVPPLSSEHAPHVNNGDRPAPDYIEGGRRTARGELFRRPPQVPPQPVAQASFVSSAPLQAPTHEITLPLGNLLHLAYNPGYTGSEEARSLLLHRLAEESKSGGRARCWNCGSLAIAYDRWNTRSRSFGEVGIAFCEICGVWSVM